MRGFAFGLLALAFAAPSPAALVNQVNLVTSNAAAHPAMVTDTDLVNPWGVAMPPGGPFWVSDNGKGVATQYQVNPVTQATVKVSATVTVAGGSVTGQAFNPSAAGGAFNGDSSLFVAEDGTISGWRSALGTNTEVLQLSSTSNVYKGSTIGVLGGNTYLLSANFKSGNIDVLKGSAGTPDLAGRFTDPGLPANFAPFNVQNLGGTIYVTYAKQNPPGIAHLAGAGLGLVSAFDTNGNFLRRVATQGTLNAPWGLAIAPASFGELAGDLLVGNRGDGKINAYNLSDSTFAGQVNGTNNQPLVIDGLWALTVGNDGTGGSSSALYFTAGPDNQANGLFGVLVPEPGCVAMLVPALVLCRRRWHGR